MPNDIHFKNHRLNDNSPYFSKETYGDLAVTLTEASSCSNIYNIGIIAGFSSGKSSLLETFYRSLPCHQPLIYKSEKRSLSQATTRYVSVADFDETKRNADGKLTPNDRKDIESEIVKQLLFSVSPKTVPSSRIDRIGHFTWRSFFAWVFLLLGLGFLALGFLAQQHLFPFESGNAPEMKVIVTMFGLSGLFFFLFLVFLSLLFPVKKVSFTAKGLVAEGEKKIEAGLLDCYFDELVYLFRKSRINLVIFEDVDRFKDVQLLLDVRALNFELNRDPEIQRRGGVAFVYAVNESLHYKAEDQAKFFDITLPVIPMLNPYNAAETLLGSEIMKLDLHPEKEEVLLLARHISDKRMANEIIDDYLIYLEENKEAFQTQTDVNALFALMVYKHVAPQDFALVELDDKQSALAVKIRNFSKNAAAETDSNFSQNSLLDDMISSTHSYVGFDYLRYISRYSSELFANRCDRDFYERVVKNAHYGEIAFALKDRASLFDLIPAQCFSSLACLDFDFVDEIVDRLSFERGNYSTKTNNFLLSFEKDNPQRRTFLSAYFEHNRESNGKRSEILIKDLYPTSSWLFSFLMSLNLAEADRNLLLFFLSNVLFANLPEMSSLMNDGGNGSAWTALKDFFTNSKDPASDFRDSLPDVFANYLSHYPFKIRMLEKFPHTPITEKIFSSLLFAPTINNFQIVLRDYFGVQPVKGAFFTCVKRAKNDLLWSYAMENFTLLVKEWLDSRRDFGEEDPDVVKTIVNLSLPSLDKDSLLAFLKSVASKEKIPFNEFAITQRAEIVYESGILPLDLNLLGKLLSNYSYRSRLVAFLLTERKGISDTTKLDNNGRYLLSSLLTDSSYAFDSHQLAEIITCTDFPSVELASSYTSLGIEALAYSNRIIFNPINWRYACKSDASFEAFLDRFSDQVIQLSSFAPIANDTQATYLFNKCRNDLEKKKVFFALEEKLSTPEFWPSIRGLVDKDFLICYLPTMALILGDKEISFEVKAQLVFKYSGYVDRKQALLCLADNDKGCRESLRTGKPFSVPATGYLADFCRFLLSGGLLVSQNSDDSTKTIAFSVASSYQQKEK